MKKYFKVLIAVLVICVSLTAFLACGNDETDAKGKSVEQVTALFEDAGYTVSSKTVSGVSALVGIKGTDVITVLFYENEKQATEAKSTWDVSAQTASLTCKQDKNNIYYGTTAAIAVYDGTGGTSGGNGEEPGDNEEDSANAVFGKMVSDAFKAQGYVAQVSSGFSFAIVCYKIDSDSGSFVEYIEIHVETDEEEADLLYDYLNEALPEAEKQFELSFICKRDKSNVYYGTTSAIELFESL